MHYNRSFQSVMKWFKYRVAAVYIKLQVNIDNNIQRTEDGFMATLDCVVCCILPRRNDEFSVFPLHRFFIIINENFTLTCNAWIPHSQSESVPASFIVYVLTIPL